MRRELSPGLGARGGTGVFHMSRSSFSFSFNSSDASSIDGEVVSLYVLKRLLYVPGVLRSKRARGISTEADDLGVIGDAAAQYLGLECTALFADDAVAEVQRQSVFVIRGGKVDLRQTSVERRGGRFGEVQEV